MTSADRTAPEGATAEPTQAGRPLPADEVLPADEALPADESLSADQPEPADEILPDEVVPPDASGEPADADGLSDTIAALTDDSLEQSERRWLLGRLAGEIRARGIGDLFRPRAAMRWVADAVSDVAPRLPIRDYDTLSRHFPGLSDDALAERLIRNAARTTAAIGAASGGVASIEWVATPTLLSAPVLLAAETVAVVAIEIKLIGELHVVYGSPIVGTRSERAVALVQAWAQRRGINPTMLPVTGVAAMLGTATRKELRDRLLRRFGRNLTTYGPMLTGAAVASYLNRRSTLSLGQQIRKDLGDRSRRSAITQWPTQPQPRD
ncbi:hypothetical protein GCM10023322_16320 [Rugosimonospora acidiphila]|uniref:EcsC protein family protein n=1 Tax=Rugosimonospora acidiphila TaxID=556531 RepID=A0ABP9RND5_9ACTN